jgi:hypothetical protein
MNHPSESTRSDALAEDLEAACRLLRQSQADSPSTPALQQALKQVTQSSDLQILGICADSLTRGRQVLAAYAAALDLPQPTAEFADLAGAVYVKFNPGRQCYASPYSGSERGVLVSCQSAEESDVNELFGPLPLDLFPAEA